MNHGDKEEPLIFTVTFYISGKITTTWWSWFLNTGERDFYEHYTTQNIPPAAVTRMYKSRSSLKTRNRPEN